MQSAAPKTYISKRMLDKYSEQRSQKLKAKLPVAAKSFAEDNNSTQNMAA